jgi:hypothetical protein
VANRKKQEVEAKTLAAAHPSFALVKPHAT